MTENYNVLINDMLSLGKINQYRVIVFDDNYNEMTSGILSIKDLDIFKKLIYDSKKAAILYRTHDNDVIKKISNYIIDYPNTSFKLIQ
ncbi:MAG: hypothetical protein ACOC1K_02535 [Nanoarchaeota archaeon]